MVFQITKENVKLFGIVLVGIVVFLLLFIAPENWWFLWDYLAETPPWFVIGESYLLVIAAFTITVFLIIIRELIK